MASAQECGQALESVAVLLSRVDPEVLRRHVVERTVSWRVPDLDVVYTAHLDATGLGELHCESGQVAPRAQIRLTAASDDLVALLRGQLSPSTAWLTGRLRVEASIADLLRLRSVLQRNAAAPS